MPHTSVSCEAETDSGRAGSRTVSLAPLLNEVCRSRSRALKLALSCVGLAGLIVRSVLPRPDRIEPPGPRIFERDEPGLFSNSPLDLLHQVEYTIPREALR